MPRKAVSAKMMERTMEEMLLARGYHAVVDYVENEVEVYFNLDDAVTMTLSFSNTETPDKVVAYAASMMDKLNRKVSA